MTKHIERASYPIELIISGANSIYNSRDSKWVQSSHKRALVLYCLSKFEDGYMPLNRDYKPVGVSGYSEWIDYKDFGFLLISDLDVEELKLNRYLFHDGSAPWYRTEAREYLVQLVRVFSRVYPAIYHRMVSVIENKHDYTASCYSKLYFETCDALKEAVHDSAKWVIECEFDNRPAGLLVGG